MKKRILSLLLVLVMLLGLLPTVALAEDDTSNHITIDLTDYPHNISGTEKNGDTTNFTINAGEKKVFRVQNAG